MPADPQPPASTSDAVFAAADFESVEVVADRAAGLIAFLVVHDTRLGPAFGGVRCRRYPTLAAALADAQALARAMTFKCALAGIPGGGGKCVIVETDDLRRDLAYDRIADHVDLLAGRYYTGPDLGTSAAELERMAQRTRFVAHPSGPTGQPAEATALGVAASLARTVEAVLGRGLDGLRVTVQGLGAVGSRLANRLAQAGCRLLVADPVAERVQRARDELGAEAVPVDEVLRRPADVLAPCAGGGVIDRAVARELAVRAVVGAANNVLADAAAGEQLHRRGIACAPDFVANAGGVLQGAVTQLTGTPPPPRRIEAIGDVVVEVLQRAVATDTPPHRVALHMAAKRLHAHPHVPFFPARAAATTIRPRR